MCAYVGDMPYVDRVADVFVLNLGDRDVDNGENRMGPAWVADVEALLDEVEAATGPAALVTTATGKYFSNGVDLSWGAENLDQVNLFIGAVQSLLARVLTFPMQTVAALQGHTFGGAAFFAMAHDYRVMRADRGFLCFPGVSIGASYSPGTVRLVAAKLTPLAFHEALTTGRRYGGDDAATLGLVDSASAEDRLLDDAIARATELTGTRGSVLGDIKRTMYSDVVESLLAPVAGVEEQEWTMR
jgi:enoyl-CoA hydratase/carnithine racemase